jgi:hypothetical protein
MAQGPQGPQGPIDLTCREIVELVTAYLGRTLSPPERVRLEQHLLTCPPCTSYLAQMRTTVALLGGLDEASPGGDDVPAVMDVFRRWGAK